MSISQKTVKIIGFSLLILALGLFAANEIMGLDLFAPQEGVLRFVQKPFTISHGSGEIKRFYAPDSGGYFYAARDGVRYLDAEGGERMSVMYGMNEPEVKGDGNIAAVCEKNGTSIFVLSPEGALYEGKTEYPILSFSVNSSGYSSVITKQDNNYNLTVFNNLGGVQSEGVWEETNIFPIASDVSGDNKALAVVTLDINNISMNSVITFVYLNQSDTLDIKDGIVGSNAENEDELIGRVSFMNDNKFISVSDKVVKCVDLSQNCATVWELPLKNQLTAVSFMDGSRFALAYGGAISDDEPKKSGTVEVFDLGLMSLGNYDISQGHAVTSLSFGFDTLVIGAGRNFFAVDGLGETKWEFAAPADVEQFMLVDNSETILVSGTAETGIWSLEMDSAGDGVPARTPDKSPQTDASAEEQEKEPEKETDGGETK